MPFQRSKNYKENFETVEWRRFPFLTYPAFLILYFLKILVFQKIH